MTAAWIAGVVLGYLLLAAVVGSVVGHHLHLAGHRAGVADPADCPDWCRRRRRRGRHHMPLRTRVRVQLGRSVR